MCTDGSNEKIIVLNKKQGFVKKNVERGRREEIKTAYGGGETH